MTNPLPGALERVAQAFINFAVLVENGGSPAGSARVVSEGLRDEARNVRASEGAPDGVIPMSHFALAPAESKRMLIAFQDRLGELIDEYLKQGVAPYHLRYVMNDEMDKDGMEERAAELKREDER